MNTGIAQCTIKKKLGKVSPHLNTVGKLHGNYNLATKIFAQSKAYHLVWFDIWHHSTCFGTELITMKRMFYIMADSAHSGYLRKEACENLTTVINVSVVIHVWNKHKLNAQPNMVFKVLYICPHGPTKTPKHSGQFSWLYVVQNSKLIWEFQINKPFASKGLNDVWWTDLLYITRSHSSFQLSRLNAVTASHDSGQAHA